MTTTQRAFESVVGAGAMINWISVAAAHVPIYEDWYNFQHLPERVSTPGFLRGRRFVATQQSDADRVDYLTLYETVDVNVLQSAEYLRRLDNPTELTLRVVPLFSEFRRAAAKVTVVCGDGSSSRVVVVEVETDDPAALRDVLAAEVFPGLIADHRLVAASLYEPDGAVSDAKNATAEGQSSAQQTAASAAVILAELHPGVDADQLAADIAARAAHSSARFGHPHAARSFDLVYELRSVTHSFPGDQE